MGYVHDHRLDDGTTVMLCVESQIPSSLDYVEFVHPATGKTLTVKPGEVAWSGTEGPCAGDAVTAKIVDGKGVLKYWDELAESSAVFEFAWELIAPGACPCGERSSRATTKFGWSGGSGLVAECAACSQRRTLSFAWA